MNRKNNTKSFSNISHTNKSSKYSMPKFNYYDKICHIALSYFIIKSHENKIKLLLLHLISIGKHMN